MRKQAVDTIWKDFIQWCAKRQLRSLPAHPWTLAAYLRWREETAGHTDAERIVEGVAKAHRRKGKRSPHRDSVVERTVALIANKRDAKESGSDLFDADSLLFERAEPPPEAIEEADESDEAPADPPTGRKLSSTPKLVSRRPR